MVTLSDIADKLNLIPPIAEQCMHKYVIYLLYVTPSDKLIVQVCSIETAPRRSLRVSLHYYFILSKTKLMFNDQTNICQVWNRHYCLLGSSLWLVNGEGISIFLKERIKLLNIHRICRICLWSITMASLQTRALTNSRICSRTPLNHLKRKRERPNSLKSISSLR